MRGNDTVIDVQIRAADRAAGYTDDRVTGILDRWDRGTVSHRMSPLPCQVSALMDRTPASPGHATPACARRSLRSGHYRKRDRRGSEAVNRVCYGRFCNAASVANGDLWT